MAAHGHENATRRADRGHAPSKRAEREYRDQGRKTALKAARRADADEAAHEKVMNWHMRRLASPALAILLTVPAAVWSQGNAKIAGNWEIDEAKSEIGRGRAGGPGPSRMIVKIGLKEVTVISDTGVNRAKETTVYMVDAPEHEVPGPLSWNSVAKSTWENDKFVVTIARIIEGPNGPVRIEMKDVYTVTGDTLMLERTQGVTTWKSVFNRR